MPQKNRLFDLFITFFKVGAFTFGGGYAMLPLIQREVIETHHWLSSDEFIELIAIAEITPGPVAINTATFVGYRTAGVLGASMATLGVVLPSFSIILLIALFFPRIASHPLTQRMFYGIRPAVVALIGSAIYKLGKNVLVNGFSYSVTVGVFLGLLLMGIPPIPMIFFAAAAGVLDHLRKQRPHKQHNNH